MTHLLLAFWKEQGMQLLVLHRRLVLCDSMGLMPSIFGSCAGLADQVKRITQLQGPTLNLGMRRLPLPARSWSCCDASPWTSPKIKAFPAVHKKRICRSCLHG